MDIDIILAVSLAILLLINLFAGVHFMAGIAELNAALDTQAQAIVDLTNRIANLPGAVDLQPAVDRVKAQTAELTALAQPTP